VRARQGSASGWWGKTWQQDVTFHDGQRDGRYLNSWRVGSGVERLHVLAGSFYTVRIERRGGEAEGLETSWYSPLVRYWVRFESYVGGYVEELVEYRLSPSGATRRIR
jgi:hypothetical protein